MSIETALSIIAFALCISNGLSFVVILILGDTLKAHEALNKILASLVERHR